MNERDHIGHESDPQTKYFAAHHDKADHPIYSVVPEILTNLLDTIPVIEGFSIGGSYANGRYSEGDDVDVDMFFDSYPQQLDHQIMRQEIERQFRVNGITCEIRAPLAKSSLPALMRRELYSSHPHTPFVVRTENIAKDWGLIDDSITHTEDYKG